MAHRRRVMVVDDIPLMRTMLSKLVERLGPKILFGSGDGRAIEIVEAADGQEAFQILQANEIDVVFLDLMMPDMDGFAFLATKQQEPTLSHVPVIVCSALKDSETFQRASDLGAFSTIRKPFTMRAVEENLRNVAAIL